MLNKTVTSNIKQDIGNIIDKNVTVAKRFRGITEADTTKLISDVNDKLTDIITYINKKEKTHVRSAEEKYEIKKIPLTNREIGLILLGLHAGMSSKMYHGIPEYDEVDKLRDCLETSLGLKTNEILNIRKNN